jgi:hypothetical protein
MKLSQIILPAYLLLTFIILIPSAAAQTCKKTILVSNPDASYSIHNDGTVTHQVTELMWMRCSLGMDWNGKTCSGEAATLSWGGALQRASRHAFAGYSDWRLPNKNELETILEESCNMPAINERVFPATPTEYFWSSSPSAGLSIAAWSINFGYGAANASVKDGLLSVRLVRGGR